MVAARRPRKKTSARKPGVSYETVVRLGLALPGTVAGTSYGTPALKAGKALFARLKEDGETLVLKMDMVSRDFVMRAEPGTFFVTDHYRDYPYVLVRLSQVDEPRMAELLEDAWRMVATRKLLTAHDGPDR